MATSGGPVVLAAADVGSNATKMLVCEAGADRLPRERIQKRYPLRLDDAFRTGQIGPATVSRLVETFKDIAGLAQEHGARQIRAVATEAFRSARNAAEVAREIAAKTGISLEVISPQVEGLFVTQGVMLDKMDHRDEILILDIGGGSAQIIFADNATRRVRTTSVPLGAVRLRHTFMHTDPLKPADFNEMRRHVNTVLARGAAAVKKGWTLAFGVGGGVRFLHAMCGILHGTLLQNQPVRPEHVDHLCQTIWAMSSDALVRHYGIDHERAEIIVPGAVVLVALMKHLNIRDLQPSSRGVRDGLLVEMMRNLR